MLTISKMQVKREDFVNKQITLENSEEIGNIDKRKG